VAMKSNENNEAPLKFIAGMEAKNGQAKSQHPGFRSS
jgi:hypothetical protein